MLTSHFFPAKNVDISLFRASLLDDEDYLTPLPEEDPKPRAMTIITNSSDSDHLDYDDDIDIDEQKQVTDDFNDIKSRIPGFLRHMHLDECTHHTNLDIGDVFIESEEDHEDLMRFISYICDHLKSFIYPKYDHVCVFYL